MNWMIVFKNDNIIYDCNMKIIKIIIMMEYNMINMNIEIEL
jgi:hypothetical protein